MSIVVRAVEEADLPALRELQARPELELVDSHYRAHAAGELIFAVAVDGDEMLGTALLDLDAGQWTPELRNMYVYPSARRRGAGRALSRWIEQYAGSKGFKEVYLAVDPGNEKAIPLYVSLEYHPIGEHILVDEHEVLQVPKNVRPSTHYAVYKKSLTAH
ncbi:MAG: GNAT family N-acetyltransferase [Propionibacterium sp.]|nr:GNAT family N-acetyltransferase [Propionibacterium sp.]